MLTTARPALMHTLMLNGIDPVAAAAGLLDSLQLCENADWNAFCGSPSRPPDLPLVIVDRQAILSARHWMSWPDPLARDRVNALQGHVQRFIWAVAPYTKNSATPATGVGRRSLTANTFAELTGLLSNDFVFETPRQREQLREWLLAAWWESLGESTAAWVYLRRATEAVLANAIAGPSGTIHAGLGGKQLDDLILRLGVDTGAAGGGPAEGEGNRDQRLASKCTSDDARISLYSTCRTFQNSLNNGTHARPTTASFALVWAQLGDWATLGASSEVQDATRPLLEAIKNRAIPSRKHALDSLAATAKEFSNSPTLLKHQIGNVLVGGGQLRKPVNVPGPAVQAACLLYFIYSACPLPASPQTPVAVGRPVS